jgi:hypothetical protein
MSDLVEFLLARVAEDEEDARNLIEQRAKLGPYEPGPGLAAWVVVPFDEPGHPGDPARVLAECEAKRAIVRSWRRLEAEDYGEFVVGGGPDPGIGYASDALLHTPAPPRRRLRRPSRLPRGVASVSVIEPVSVIKRSR